MTSKSRWLIFLVSTPLVVLAAVGGLIGANAVSAPQKAVTHLRVFEDVVSLIMSSYVEEADPERMHTNLVALRAQPHHEVGTRVHCRKPAHPHMPEYAEHRQLALLVEEGVVGKDGEVDVQFRPPGST